MNYARDDVVEDRTFVDENAFSLDVLVSLNVLKLGASGRTPFLSVKPKVAKKHIRTLKTETLMVWN